MNPPRREAAPAASLSVPPEQLSLAGWVHLTV
jgi:hypothetical protein